MTEQGPVVSSDVRGRAWPLRYAIRTLGVAAPLLFIALLIYGVLATSTSHRIDDNLAHARSVAAPSFRLAVLAPGDLGPLLTPRLNTALSSGHLSTSDLRGTPVVLNFWASWCVPCQQEAPLLERTWRQQARPGGVLFLGLDMQDITTDARDFLHQFHIDYLNIRDPGNPVAHRYDVTGVPETFFISAQGKIVGHVIGVTSAAQLGEGIAAARAGQTQSVRRGGARRRTR